MSICLFFIAHRRMKKKTALILQEHSTFFGRLPHPSSGVHETVTTASGTGHNVGAATSLQHVE